MSDTVTVVVPCYNATAWLADCLRSALRCAAVDEVIVVDDGSVDDPQQVVTAVQDARVRLIRQDNSGAAAARARGQQLARGAWLLFLDADDVLRPEGISRLLAHADGADAVYGDVEIVDAQGRHVSLRDQRPPVSHPVASILFRAPLSGSVVFRRTRLGDWWSSTHQSVDEFYCHARTAISGARFRHVPEAVLKYRQHPATSRLSNQGFDYGAALARAFLSLESALTPQQCADRRLSGYLYWIFLDLGTSVGSPALRHDLLERAFRLRAQAPLGLRFAFRWYGPRRLARMASKGWLRRPA